MDECLDEVLGGTGEASIYPHTHTHTLLMCVPGVYYDRMLIKLSSIVYVSSHNVVSTENDDDNDGENNAGIAAGCAMMPQYEPLYVRIHLRRGWWC